MKSFCLLLAAALTGCATMDVDQAMRAWIGRPKTQLVEVAGTPSTTTADGQGGEVLTYETKQWPAPAKGPVQNNYFEYDPAATYGDAPVQGVVHVRQFFIDPKGLIYGYRFPHPEAPGSQVP